MKYLRMLENSMIVVFFLAGVVVNLIGIGIRFFPSIPQYWVPETYTILFLTAIFIGFGTALRDRKHIIIDVVDRFTSKSVQTFLTLVSYVVSIVFGVLFLLSGYFIVMKTIDQGQTTADLGIPIWITYLVMPVSGLLILVHLIHLIIRHFGKEGE